MIEEFERLKNVFIAEWSSVFDAFPERLIKAGSRLVTRKCKQSDYVHWRWQRCYCPPVFQPAPIYPRYLYEEVHGLTGYDELYPSEKPDAFTGALCDSLKAFADAIRASGISMSELATTAKQPPEFFINH